MRWRFCVVIAFAAILAYLITFRPSISPASDLGHVLVKTASGHGSGVHIGGGLYLTAAHVTGREKAVTLILADGELFPAELLWVSAANDIVLLKAKPIPSAANLACKPLAIGQEVMAWGNPGIDRSISTWGRVAGSKRSLHIWDEVVPVDISVGPGMSGGPLYNANHDLVGITVAIALQGNGFSQWHNGISYFVPASKLCQLLGR